tara:strand:+ start:2567 stop:3313 length:747 start_codon:yes stop_codon:yes gene_type:complete
MAGHSKFKNIMHRKGAQDKKRAKLFSRLIREVSVATKLGLPDPDTNPRLRTAINNALAANMPKINIERAIKKNSDSGNSFNIDEIIYEGFGPSGIAIIIDVLTDNKNRSASEVRSIFNKYNGNLGTNGSVKHLFQRVGNIVYNSDICAFEEIFEMCIKCDVTEVEEINNQYHIITNLELFQNTLDFLEKNLKLPSFSGLDWRPKTLIDVNNDEAQKLLLLIEKLEDSDDVQNTTSNANFSEEFLETIS